MQHKRDKSFYLNTPAVVGEMGPLFRGIDDSPALLKQSEKTVDIPIVEEFIKTELVETAGTVDQLPATPRADFHWTAKLMHGADTELGVGVPASHLPKTERGMRRVAVTLW